MVRKNYLEAFQRLAEAINQHSSAALLGYHAFAPLSLAAIQGLEERYKCQLDAPMRQFYQQSNGLQLRWMLRSNPAYDPARYPVHQEGMAPKPWDYATQAHHPEEGSIFLLPLEELLRSFLPPNNQQPSITIAHKSYDTIDFYTRLRNLDAFSYYLTMGILFREEQGPLLLLGDEEGTCFTDAVPLTFEAYLAFLLASKGWILRRKEWLGQPQGYQQPTVEALPPRKNWQEAWSMEYLLLAQHFPLADHLPKAQPQVKTKKMQQKAVAEDALEVAEWQKIVAAHRLFLESGGTQGQWKKIALQGRAMGIYQCPLACDGQQAILDLQRLDKGLEFQELYLPYSSWCGVYAKGQDWSDANLTGSLMTDARLDQAIFAETNLENVDFSRSNLRGASFMNANLTGVDFENCDLTGADFRGSKRTGACFRGAVLKNILY
ncbi:MAG: pentapeptide repeat-containing protein [Aureispira sp.]